MVVARTSSLEHSAAEIDVAGVSRTSAPIPESCRSWRGGRVCRRPHASLAEGKGLVVVCRASAC